MKDLKEFDDFRISYDKNSLEKPTIGELHGIDMTKEGKFHIHERGIIYEVLVSQVFGWEHFSAVAIAKDKFGLYLRIPNPDEMDMLREKFFNEDEMTIEVHPKKDDYVNINPYALHLWRRYDTELPTPPQVTFFEMDTIDLGKKDLKLLIKTGSKDDWDGFEISVLKNNKPLKRQPSWDEMCLARQFICGENTVAIEFHCPLDSAPKYTRRLWILPNFIDFPLPDPFLVGIRNAEDMKKLFLKSITYKEPN